MRLPNNLQEALPSRQNPQNANRCVLHMMHVLLQIIAEGFIECMGFLPSGLRPNCICFVNVHIYPWPSNKLMMPLMWHVE